jgi:hypothetical protein
MNYNPTILGIAAAAAVLAANGCSKQDSSAPTAVNNGTRTQAPVASQKEQPAQTQKATDSPVQVPAKPESSVATSTAASAAVAPTSSVSVAASPATDSVVPLPQISNVSQPTAKGPATPDSNATKTASSALQSQQLTVTRTEINRLQALAAAATNRAIAALATTNQLASTATNQVQALLEQAKKLTSNQKYQDALATLTQLYNTKLTPEQKQQADDIKAQVEAGLAQKAASTLGNFLGGKK